MSLLAGNCQGSGGSLGNPKMLHLARLITSTNVQVIFVSETRNSRLTWSDLLNRLNVDDAHIVPAQGQSGGLWFLSRNGVQLDVLESSHHFFFALCVHKHLQKKFGLVCVYGDPHHLQTARIWRQVQNFVVTYPSLPFICMGDLNDIMHPSEKLGPRVANARQISEFCCLVKDCGFFLLGLQRHCVHLD